MSSHQLQWQVGFLRVGLLLDPGKPPAISALSITNPTATVQITAADRPLPLVEIGVVGLGRSWSSRRFIDSVGGAGLVYVDHWEEVDGDRSTLLVAARHPQTGLQTRTRLEASRDAAAVRVTTTVTNLGDAPVELAWVTSAAVSGLLPGSADPLLRWARNDWLAENRWCTEDLGAVLSDVSRSVHEHDPRGAFEVTALGAWSTDGALPLGIVEDPESGRALGWQLEHNGPWHWQVGDRGQQRYLSALGPTDSHHQWSETLQPSQDFTAVPVVLAASTTGFHGVITALTHARRAVRRPHLDHVELPVVFNDYMNTLMGDPTTERLLPLIDAAAAVGAEIFCIDAGWYDDDAAGWWDSVGRWEPAEGRFPGGGLAAVVDHIRTRGLRPGLWLEPEVVGVRSPVADELPPEAFFQRRGRRLVEHGRYHLDLRHPAARAHLDSVVDRLVADFGIRYFKLDHNINIGAGTDVDADTPGAGLLEHNRALTQWLADILDRHPGLTLENCASGGMRVDYAQLSVLQLQSTSDQQDPLRYPPIAAAAAAAIAPEQAASWAYPQPGDDPDRAAFTLNTAMLGRVYLSGFLSHMSEQELALVTDAVTAYKCNRGIIATGHPFWPWGLPGWEDGWISHGVATDTKALLTVWRRPGRGGDETSRTVPLPKACGSVQIIFPENTTAKATLVDPHQLTVTLPQQVQAVTVKLVVDESAEHLNGS